MGVRVEVQDFIGFLNQYRNKDQHLVPLFTICKDFYFSVFKGFSVSPQQNGQRVKSFLDTIKQHGTAIRARNLRGFHYIC